MKLGGLNPAKFLVIKNEMRHIIYANFLLMKFIERSVMVLDGTFYKIYKKKGILPGIFPYNLKDTISPLSRVQINTL